MDFTNQAKRRVEGCLQGFISSPPINARERNRHVRRTSYRAMWITAGFAEFHCHSPVIPTWHRRGLIPCTVPRFARVSRAHQGTRSQRSWHAWPHQHSGIPWFGKASDLFPCLCSGECNGHRAPCAQPSLSLFPLQCDTSFPVLHCCRFFAAIAPYKSNARAISDQCRDNILQYLRRSASL